MEVLIEERPADDAEALHEWASAHDFIGREEEAIPLYRRALEAGLGGKKRSQALIQLGSSLRNVGETESAISVLGQIPGDSVTGDAHRAFLALALYDAGRYDEALHVALKALVPTLPLYGRAVSAYADGLIAQDPQPSA